jgi:hypothetical protein
MIVSFHELAERELNEAADYFNHSNLASARLAAASAAAFRTRCSTQFGPTLYAFWP